MYKTSNSVGNQNAVIGQLIMMSAFQGEEASTRNLYILGFVITFPIIMILFQVPIILYSYSLFLAVLIYFQREISMKTLLMTRNEQTPGFVLGAEVGGAFCLYPGSSFGGRFHPGRRLRSGVQSSSEIP